VKHILLCTIFSLVLGPLAQAATRAEWKAGLYGRSTDDRFSSSKTVGTLALLKVDHEISESLKAFFLGGVALETGSSSALFTDEFEPKSHFILGEASLQWKPNAFSAKFGALDQSHHESPLLLAGGTFPAALAALDLQQQGWIFHLDAQGAILTSRTFSTRATGKENTPTLATQKAVAGYKTDKTSILLRATHFEFRNLTRGMAQDSRFYGNTVSGIGNASQFVYNFQGFEFGPTLSIPLFSSLQWTLGGSRVHNNKGPVENNQGLYGFTELEYQQTTFSVAPKIEWYRNKTDSVPGYFSEAEFGHNNRKGLGAGLRIELPKLQIELKARRSNLIQPRTFQKDRFDYFELRLELPYAGF